MPLASHISCAYKLLGSMGTLNRILNFVIKALLIVVGLTVATVPVVYILGHEAVWTQEWSSELGRFAGRAEQLAQAANSPLSNIYLRTEKSKLTWRDVNATIQLADYIHHELQIHEVTVVRRLLKFKKPPSVKKAKKGDEEDEGSQWQDRLRQTLGESNQLKENPPLSWLKELLEPYLSFEHETLKRKHWIIVCLGDLDPKLADEIENLRKSSPLHRFIIVSPWPLTSKFVQITPIPFSGVPEDDLVPVGRAGQPSAEEAEKQQLLDVEKAKGKGGKKYKVKVVKESKVENHPQNEAQSSNSTQEL